LKRPSYEYGARLLFGFKDASERIQIVTGNDRPVGRQMMNKMTVAVVNDVEYVKLVPVSAKPPRVVAESINKSLGGMCYPFRTDHRRVTQESYKPWTHSGRAHGCAVVARQMMGQHVRDKIHAEPALFGEVRDNGDAQRYHEYCGDCCLVRGS
jgi:hypothetical protein